MVEKNIRCIICPLGCTALVEIDDKGCHVHEGYRCKKGVEYAKSEALDPKRIVTTSVFVEGGEWPLVSVRTSYPVPKNMIFPIMVIIRKTTIMAPVITGQVILHNIFDLNTDIVATKNVKKKGVN